MASLASRDLDPNSRSPLYLQVMQAIADEVAAGHVRPGERLPSERRLSESFGISRVTARRALNALVSEGVVEASRGRGWFVASGPLSEPPNMLLSFSAMGRSRGLQPSAEVLTRDLRPAALDEAGILQVVPGARILDLERLRLLDGHPVAVGRSRVPLARCPSIAEVDFVRASLYEELHKRFGIVPSYADYTATAQGVSDRIASLLGLDGHDPALVIDSLAYDQHNRPIELGQMIYRGDHYRFHARLWRRPLGVASGLGTGSGPER